MREKHPKILLFALLSKLFQRLQSEYFTLNVLGFQIRITVWSLINKTVSYIKYPKECTQGNVTNTLSLNVVKLLLVMFVFGFKGGYHLLARHHTPSHLIRIIGFNCSIHEKKMYVWTIFGVLCFRHVFQQKRQISSSSGTTRLQRFRQYFHHKLLAAT